MADINGTEGNDTLTADETFNEVINGLGGNDVINAVFAAEINGGAGDDSLTAFESPRIDGGLGNDTLTAEMGNSGYFGGDGDDLLRLRDSLNKVDGGAGNDTVTFDADSSVFLIEHTDFGLGFTAQSGSDYRDLNEINNTVETIQFSDRSFTYAEMLAMVAAVPDDPVTPTPDGVTLAIAKLENANVAVFDNSSYVDTGGTTHDEADNIQASLTSLGHNVSTFTGTSSADFGVALVDQDVLLFPEFEVGDFMPVAATQQVIRGFVAAGGTLIINGDSGGGDEALLNAVFGFSLVSGTNRSSGESAATGTRAGTTFADDPSVLPNNNGTYTIQTASLPTGALSLYESGANTAVAVMGFGAGQIVSLAFDWYNAAPTGTQDGGWLEVLDSAISTPAALESLTGTEGDDVLSGTSAHEAIDGLGGNDWIIPGGGSDRIDGGDGVDMVSYFDRTTSLDFNQASGIAAADGFANFLSHIEGVTGTSFDDVFECNTGSFRGLGGNDTFVVLPGGSGLSVEGGSGADFVNFLGSTADTSVSLLRGRGYSGDADGMQISGVEKLRTGTGDDELTGDHGNNMLYSLTGDDTLIGNGGNDTLHGGDGIDVAVFSYNQDQYEITITGGRAIVDYIGTGPGDGTDVVDFVEILRFADGDLRSDLVTGTAGDDWLSLQWDNASALNSIQGGAGADMISFAVLGTGIYANMHTDVVHSNDPSSPFSIEMSSIENVTGTSFDDVFVGSDRAEIFRGLGGRDTFYGSDHGDRIDGGAGQDLLSYAYSDAGVTVSLLKGRGWDGEAAGDVIRNVENLTGSMHDDFIWGDHGNNKLTGGYGDDTIVGNDGDDYILAGFGTDTIVFSGNQSEYTITRDGIATTVDHTGGNGKDGTDLIGHAEILRFADGDFLL